MSRGVIRKARVRTAFFVSVENEGALSGIVYFTQGDAQTMPENFLTKITTHARHWIRAIMGSVVGIGTLVIEHFTGKPLSWSWFVALVFGGLAWHYRAELEASQKQTGELPRPFLKYEENRNVHSDASEFFVQVEGEKNAFDLEIVSEPTVGTNHKRIHMQWEIRKGVIGKTPVPVSAQFIQFEIEKAIEVPHYVSPLSSGQIKTFFERKKDPNELQITMTFKDVDGKKCPPKKFMIISEQDWRGYMRIGISPIENQAAS